MIVLSVLLFYFIPAHDSPINYLIYAIYTLGIVWTVYAFSKSESNTKKFSAFFLQAFKCFVIVTLLMVLFTFIFNKLHPEFRTEAAKNYKQELINLGNSTPAEIETSVAKMQDFYLTMVISRAIFGYLFFGAAVSAAVSLFFIKRK